MTLVKFTETKLMIPRLLSTDHAGAIKELTKKLHNAGRIDDPLAFFQAVLEREFMLRSYPESGVVFPHARGHGINSLFFAAGVSQEGIPWGSARGGRARLVILLAVPLSETQLYLGVLSGLSRLCQDEILLNRLLECHQAEEMMAVFDEVEPPMHPRAEGNDATA